MSQVTLTAKGIGPFQYKGQNYWVAPSSDRILSSWIGNKVNINDKTWDIPTVEELENVIYHNRKVIDEADTTLSAKLADIANEPNDAVNGWRQVWSSTDSRWDGAWAQLMSDGDVVFNFKDLEIWIIGIHKESII